MTANKKQGQDHDCNMFIHTSNNLYKTRREARCFLKAVQYVQFGVHLI